MNNRYIVFVFVAILVGVYADGTTPGGARVADAVTDAVESAKATVKGAAESVKEAAATGKEKIQDAAESTKEKATDAAESAKDKAQDTWTDATAKLKKIYDENIATGWETTKNKLNEHLQKVTDYGHEAREYVNHLLGKTTDPEAARLRQSALEHLKKRVNHSYKHILEKMDDELKAAKSPTAKKDLESFLQWFVDNLSDGIDKAKTALASHL